MVVWLCLNRFDNLSMVDIRLLSRLDSTASSDFGDSSNNHGTYLVSGHNILISCICRSPGEYRLLPAPAGGTTDREVQVAS